MITDAARVAFETSEIPECMLAAVERGGWERLEEEQTMVVVMHKTKVKSNLTFTKSTFIHAPFTNLKTHINILMYP